jgi:alpha-methylacyl-CoA racemase
MSDAAIPVAAGPLAGLRVLELAAIGPVPMAATLLADLGAEVLRIDRVEPSGLNLALAPEHDVHGRSRRSLMLNLREPGGREAALRALARSDVLLEGFRPGVAERLGLGPEPALALNPRLVYGRMTGFGQRGPLAQAAGHDLNYIALTGALHAIGPAGGAPLPPLNLVGDYGGGALYLAFGVMAALYERARSGRGQVVDASMVDGVAGLMGLIHGLSASGQWQGERGQNLLDGGAPFYACYRCADGLWVSVAALEPKFFSRLAMALNLPERFVPRQYDRREWPSLRAALGTAFAARERAHWCRLLEGGEACFAPVLSVEEAPGHPHAREREAYVDVAGKAQPSPAPRFDRTPTAAPTAAPRPGEHSTAVLVELGYTQTQLQTLFAQGCARQT